MIDCLTTFLFGLTTGWLLCTWLLPREDLELVPGLSADVECRGSDTVSEGSGGALERAEGAAVDLPSDGAAGLTGGSSSRIITSSVCVP